MQVNNNMSNRENVTIVSDASYNSRNKSAGFAFQMRYGRMHLKAYGPLKGKLENPTEAEMKSVLNALHSLVKSDVKIHTLTIRTDCEFIVKHMFVEKKRKEVFQVLISKMREYLEILDYTKLNIVHVRAHKTPENSAEYVNDWCDTHAKLGRRMAIPVWNIKWLKK